MARFGRSIFGGGIGFGSSGYIASPPPSPPPASAVYALSGSPTLSEGNSGTTNFTFTLTRSTNLTVASTADWAVTGSGTNLAVAADFVGGAFPSGQVSFAINETTKSIIVPVLGDVSVETDETFTVTVSNVQPAGTITTATSIGIITNDDVAPAPPPPSPPASTTTQIRAEGDSFSVDFAGSYTGAFKIDNPSLNYAIAAVGGAGIGTLPVTAGENSLLGRENLTIAANPRLYGVLIGANDLAEQSAAYFPSPDPETGATQFTTRLFDHFARVKAASPGTKIYCCTVFPQVLPGLTAHNARFEARRAFANNQIRAALGTSFDFLIDFDGSIPEMNTAAGVSNLTVWQTGGLHPTDRTGIGTSGTAGQDLMYNIYADRMLNIIAAVSGGTGTTIDAPVVTRTTANGVAPEIDITIPTNVFAGYYLRIERSASGAKTAGTYTTKTLDILYQIQPSDLEDGIIKSALTEAGYIDPAGLYFQQYRFEREDGIVSAWSNEITDTVLSVTTTWSATTGVNKNQYLTVSGRDTSATAVGVGAPCQTEATQQATVDKFVWEVLVTSINASDNYIAMGNGDIALGPATFPQMGNGANAGINFVFDNVSSSIVANASAVFEGSLPGFAVNDVITIKGDKITGNVSLYRTRSGTTIQIGTTVAVTLTNWFAIVGHSDTGAFTTNFGQTAFARALDLGYAAYG